MFNIKYLPIKSYVRLIQIFKNKKWPHTSDEPGEKNDLLINFIALLTELEDKEQELIFTLMEDFYRVTFVDYWLLLKDVLIQIPKNFFDSCNNIYILPLVKPTDREAGRIKSTHQLLYPMTQHLQRSFHIASNKIITLDGMTSLNKNHRDREKSIIIFVDDFIGSGTTVEEAIKDYMSNYRVGDDNYCIISLVTMENGLNRLSSMGYNIYASRILRRGITDSTKLPNIEEAKEIMSRIEARLAIKSKYHYGFKKSEALVKLIRTPNNTFPIFWCDKQKSGDDWPSPFIRYL